MALLYRVDKLVETSARGGLIAVALGLFSGPDTPPHDAARTSSVVDVVSNRYII
jgi:hypothetical protein